MHYYRWVIQENSHGWLDARGWVQRDFYVVPDDGKIYPGSFIIARAKDGRNIIYSAHIDISKGVDVDKGAQPNDSGAVYTSTPVFGTIPKNTAGSKENLQGQTWLELNDALLQVGHSRKKLRPWTVERRAKMLF